VTILSALVVFLDKAVAGLLKKRFRVEADFIDMGIRL
jgi:hypothetical protein